jgi:hypothetical protein
MNGLRTWWRSGGQEPPRRVVRRDAGPGRNISGRKVQVQADARVRLIPQVATEPKAIC